MLSLVFLTVLVLLYHVAIYATPLDDYVNAVDPNTKWELMDEKYWIQGDNLGFTGYMLNFTSQRWLTDEDFSPNSQSGSIWWHYLCVLVPDEITSNTNATLWITGGGMGDSAPTMHDEDMMLTAYLTRNSGYITAALFQIPNEHTTFAADPIQKSRTEDAIIAYTWDHFLKDPSNPEWLVRFPMVKASVRSMDAVTEFVKTIRPEVQLDYYTVTGASKRGWTTWLVGAVDQPRVQAIVPIVLDAINFVPVMHHQFQSYGGWSYALSDYYDLDIFSRLDDPNMLLLSQMEDPYFYASRLTMPKLIVNGAMDEFQQADDNHYWWSDMPEPKHFILAPNAEHTLATGLMEVVPDLAAWIVSTVEKKTVPAFDWKIDSKSGEITATLDSHGEVYEAYVYHAHSCGVNPDGKNRRDYRVAHLDDPCSCGIYAEGYCTNLKAAWTKTPLNGTVVRGRRTYSAIVEPPSDGRWVTFFIDITYRKDHKDEKVGSSFKPGQHGIFPKDLSGRLRFTTQVSVLPNVFPYPPCSGADCKGTLL